MTVYPCKSTSPSEVTAELHEWKDTFQMNPKAICADMASLMPSLMHKEVSLGTREIQAPKTLDQTTLAQITPAQLMRKAAHGIWPVDAMRRQEISWTQLP